MSGAAAAAPPPAVVHQRADLPPVTHDILLRAARGELTPRVPVWAMRQAGRYLPEFLETRKSAGFFTMCQTPALAADVTLQPLRRYIDLLDAVVIFSDILIVPQAMGMEVIMEPGRGPVLTAPLNEPADLDRLNLRPDVPATLGYLFDAITLTRRLAAEAVGKAVPVIGFVGAPWTLMSYMVEGGGSKTFEKSKKWLLQHPEASHTLLAALADVCVDLLVAQWAAGASILQVFESHAGELGPSQFDAFGLPYLRRIAAGVRARVPPVSAGGPPLIVFPRCAHYSLEALAADDQSGCGYDAISLDWGLDPADAAGRVKRAAAAAGVHPKALQGNLDPCELFGSHASIRSSVTRMLEGFGAETPLIGNLGHGMMPTHDPEALRAFFAAVHEVSAAMRAPLFADKAQ